MKHYFLDKPKRERYTTCISIFNSFITIIQTGHTNTQKQSNFKGNTYILTSDNNFEIFLYEFCRDFRISICVCITCANSGKGGKNLKCPQIG